MKLFILFLLMIIQLSVYAQPKISYTATLEAGVLKSKHTNGHDFLFSNGVLYKNTMIGIGAGTDNYLLRSVPVCLDVRKLFGNHHLQPFVAASAGISLPYLTHEQKQPYGPNSGADYQTGFFMKSSVGVSINSHRRLRVFIATGYSYKTTKITYAFYTPSPGVPAEHNTDIFRMNRWLFSSGFWF